MFSPLLRHFSLVAVLCVSLTSMGWAADEAIYTDADLLALASNHTAEQLRYLTLGDGHYTLDGPHKGYIYFCHLPHSEEGGAQANGPWIHGTTWNPDEKVSISGEQLWSNAFFKMDLDQNQRSFIGNGLPLTHPTGFFPVQQTDPAFRYDRNPNSIQIQSYSQKVASAPSYNDPPFCMNMEAGIMLTGVPLFNGFDAGLRDAAAHELQDKCNGHPQQRGQYHYHSLSRCIANPDTHTVIGYALDGFPITGGQVQPGKYLMTDDLDVCHGLFSEINLDGQKKVSYHYVMTPDFPYSVSCFRSKPASAHAQSGGLQQTSEQPSHQFMPQAGAPHHPPQEAISACMQSSDNTPCSFTSPRGDIISGECRTIPEGVLACVPRR